MLQRLWNDDTGVIISAELALILTIAVIAIIVGLSETAIAINTELNDLSNAIGALDQSYFYTGLTGRDKHHGKLKSFIAGSRYNDHVDDCDFNGSCDLVCGIPRRGGEGGGGHHGHGG